MLEDSRDELWIGGNFGLDRLDRSRQRRTKYRNDPDDPTSLTLGNVRGVDQHQIDLVGLGRG